jgi:hypothetical protein
VNGFQANSTCGARNKDVNVFQAEIDGHGVRYQGRCPCSQGDLESATRYSRMIKNSPECK